MGIEKVFSISELSVIKERFMELTKRDEKGKLNQPQFKALLTALGMKIPSSLSIQMFKLFDTSKSRASILEMYEYFPFT